MLIPNVLCCLILWDTSYKCLLWQKPILWHIFPYIYGTILDRKYSKSWNSVHNVFLNIYHTVFKRKKFLHLHCQSTIGVHTEHTKYQSIEFLTLSEYHAIWGLTVVWRLIICHLHQNLEKNIYDIPYCAIHLILFENWKRFLSTYFFSQNGGSIQRCCIVRKFEICDIFEMRNLKWFRFSTFYK